MKKLLFVTLTVCIALGTVMCKKKSASLVGIWEVMGHKANNNGVERTEYWVVTDSTMLWTQWKDAGTGTYDEVKTLTDGFRFKYKIENNIITLGEKDNIKMKIIDLKDNTAIIETPSADGLTTVQVNLKRIIR